MKYFFHAHPMTTSVCSKSKLENNFSKKVSQCTISALISFHEMFRVFCALDTLEVECEFFKFQDITYKNCNGYIERALKMFRIVLHKTTSSSLINRINNSQKILSIILWDINTRSVQVEYLKKIIFFKKTRNLILTSS